MAAVNGDSAIALASKTTTPIAQLGPDLPDQASRAVRGDITITWPYNSVTKKLAFLIAEPDVRLRRAKGQIRIELQGPSATAASECGLGAGDELLFSLDGAEWSKDESPGRIPGARVEWQLQFNQKLNLEVKYGESGEVKHINIDHPTQALPDGPAIATPWAATPNPEPSVLEIPATVRKIPDLPPNEYPSPAFVKRARLSYGALFEGGFDIFEEDGGIKGRGRKRTKFGRDSSAWRYTSQSPSPERTSPVPDAMDEDVLEDVTPQPSPKPQMMDEGCQTVEVEMAQAPDIVDAALPQRETIPVPVPREGSAGSVDEELTPIRQTEQVPASSILREEPVPVIPEQEGPPPVSESSSIINSKLAPEPHEESPQKPAEEKPPTNRTPATVAWTSPPPAGASGTVTSTLFGPKSFASSFSSFGTGAPAGVESTLSLADQVRFGFSHVPQTTRSPSPPRREPAPEPDHDRQDMYPASYLDAPDPAKYAEMNTYLNTADEQAELAVHGQTMPPRPPAVERFGDGQWEMSTQPPQYNPIEGAHFGADALDEGTRVMAEQAPLHADTMAPERVPEGFATYGHEDAAETHEESPPRQPLPHEDQPLVENEDTISGDEVGVDDEEDEDAEFDEYAYGERIEEGDYDQRKYDSCSDDDEGLSEEEEEAELEAEERYGNGEMYDEDGEGDEWDEEEEDYESEEEDYEEEEEDEMGGYPTRKPAPAPTGEPVVISLLSDSEDEDEPAPAPAPRKPAPVPQAPHVPEPLQEPLPEPPTSQRGPPSSPRLGSPDVLETVETESPEHDQVPNNPFGRTQVVDFAERYAASQRPKVPLAEMDTETGSFPPTSQVPNSFDMINARDGSRGPDSGPAPSEGSSDGLFVSQSMPLSVSSESSSEGLFISQPRARAPQAEEGGTDDGSSVVREETDEGTDAGTVSEPEQPRTRDESPSVIEIEEDETVSASFASRDDDAAMPDAGGLSFVSQVELPEELVEDKHGELLEDEDEELLEDEDESMTEFEMPSKPAVSMETTWSSFEVEEVTSSAGDVVMLDASAQFESASPEVPPQSQGTSRAVSELVITETVSEAAAGAVADEPLLTSQIPVQEEGGSPPPSAEERELAADEVLQGMPEAAVDQAEPLTAQADGQKTQEEPTSKLGVLPSTAEKLDADVVAEQQAHAQVPAKAPIDVVGLPAEAEQEIDDSLPADGMAIDSSEATCSSELAPATEPREDGVVSDPSVPAQLSTVVRLDEGTSESEPVAIPSQAGQAREEQAADGTGGSVQQMQEPETSQQHRTATADDEDEAMILEQLTQEQQQHPEAEAAEVVLRTNSSSPDISVDLARQAVAAKCPKKAPEQRRTSPRITRARSNSLRSNATNGTPEQDEDASVALARAALASPSKQEEDSSVSLARAALASPSKRAAVVDGTRSPTPTTTSNTTTAPTQNITTLKSDLAKRLRTELPECVPLKSLTKHVDKFPNAVAVVTSHPTAPVRAKGGPREYFMSFHVTDPSAAPSTVVEVQLYRPHKDSLPVVKPGDVVLLQRFQVKALSKKGWGLRTGVESAWAVWDGSSFAGVDGDGNDGQVAPQIRGPPVEDWEGYVGYVRGLREWFGLVMADGGLRGKLERADRKLVEAGGGGK